jgi:hypothetical protein
MPRRIMTPIIAVALAACTPDASTREGGQDPLIPAYNLSAGENRELAALRAATARFQRFEVARDAGWNVQFPEGCFESATGGMGFHYMNAGAGTLVVTEPNFLMYEPQKNGRMRLVGVEYMAPGDLPRPSLFGQQFDWNADFGVWVLHVWAFAHNPAGLFEGYNPTISCDHAVVASATHH